MGKFKGKAKTADKPQAVTSRKAQPAEFSDDSDAVISDEEETGLVDDELGDDDGEAEEFLSPAEDDEEDDEEGEGDVEDDEGGVRWGTKRSDFYKRDEESSEDGADDFDNEQEAIRLLKKRQSKLKAEDLELGGEVDDDDDDEPENKRSGPVIVRKSKSGDSKRDGDDDEALASEAPEVLALLTEFSSKASEVRDAVLPVLERLKREDEVSTKEGIAYLETKTHLLLSYTINVAFYLLYRAENGAAKAESHPVVNQLVRLRTLLEKLRPLDAKLKNELDELVRRAVIAANSSMDGNGEDQGNGENGSNEMVRLPASKRGGFRPDLKDLDDAPRDDESGGEEREERYQRNDQETEVERKKREKDERRRISRAEKSDLLHELREEQSDAPEEVVDDLRAAARKSKEEAERRRYEEENFVRLRDNKKARAQRSKEEKRAAVHGGDLGTLLEDVTTSEYAQFKDLLDDTDGPSNSLRSRKTASGNDDDENDDHEGVERKKKGVTLSMHLNEMNQARKTAKKQFMSGDDDVLPSLRKLQQQPSAQELLGEREKFTSSNKAENGADVEDIEVDEGAEHPFYRETTKRRKQAADDRADAYSFPKRFAPAPVKIVEAGQTRFATREMIKNRGLTPHRNKEKKNPRKKLRLRFEDKVKARRGQVRDVKSGVGDYYQGEETGIRTSIVRSRKAGKL